MRVTVLGKEPVAAYNRVLLSSVVAGSKSPGVLGLARRRTRASRCSPASGPRRSTGTAGSSSTTGPRAPVRRPVLATGSAARVPPIQGVAYDEGLVEGVFVLKDMADATGIVDAAGCARRAVVLGAGVLGVEVATGLAKRGLSVRIVHLADRLMERQLGWEASQVAISSLERLGITTHVGASVVGVNTRRGRLESIRFADGVEAAADLFVMCCGTVAETMLARRAGLTVDRGIVVTDDLASPDDPHVHAIGDCAQPPSGATGLVAQGWQQAAALASRRWRPGPCRRAPDRRPTTSSGSRRPGCRWSAWASAGTSTATTPATACCRSRTPSVVATWRSSPPAATSSARRIGDAEVAATLSALYTRSLPVPEDPALLMVRALAGGGPAAAAKRPEELADADRVCAPATRCRPADPRGGARRLLQRRRRRRRHAGEHRLRRLRRSRRPRRRHAAGRGGRPHPRTGADRGEDPRQERVMSEHVVVVGGGMVAHRFVEALRARDTEGVYRVTVVAEEDRAPYDRVGLSAFFSGSTPDDLLLGDPTLWDDPRRSPCTWPRPPRHRPWCRRGHHRGRGSTPTTTWSSRPARTPGCPRCPAPTPRASSSTGPSTTSSP